MKTVILSLGLILAAFTGFAQVPKSKSNPEAKVYIISPSHGESVGKTFTVKFGLQEMGIAPAGINYPNTGHHHLLVDVEAMPDLNKPLPSTKNILHYGNGQTETMLTLAPGTHTLQLVFADYLHIAHDKPVISPKIRIIVK